MKKILFLLGAISLIACSEDVIQNADKLNDVVPGTNPKTTGVGSGNIKPYTSANGYESPWDI